jgi:hypothetical protein
MMPNPQYYLTYKQETRILVVLPKSSKVSLYYSKENFVARNCSKTLKSKIMDARWGQE